MTLFTFHDSELEKTFRLTKPIFNSKIIISLDETGEEEYSVKTKLSFPNEYASAEILSAREIMEQKFRKIENIVDLTFRLNDLSNSESDREGS